MMMMVIVWVIATLQSVLMKEILSRWIKSARVNRLRHVKIFGRRGSIRNGRRRIHRWIQVGVSDSDSCRIGNIIDNGWWCAWQLSRCRRIRRLNVRRARHFSLWSTCREKVAQLCLVTSIGSLCWRCCAARTVQGWRWSSIWSHQKLIGFREVTWWETRV